MKILYIFIYSIYNLGLIYRYGRYGMTTDISQAEFWFRKAAEEGFAEAQYELAYIFIDKKDNEQAIYWMQKAAENGFGNAQAFLAEHFNNLTVAFAVENLKYIGSEYEVVYTDRTEVDFSTDGEWESVERKYDAIPTSIIPAKISDYVANMGMSGQYIKKIERGRYTWEIELSNGLEIKFDKQFNVIGYDD